MKNIITISMNGAINPETQLFKSPKSNKSKRKRKNELKKKLVIRVYIIVN